MASIKAHTQIQELNKISPKQKKKKKKMKRAKMQAQAKIKM